MKEKKLKELHNSFHEFGPLYYKKFGVIFHKEDGIQPKCYKNQIRAMFIIHDNEKITPTDLGKCMDLRKGSLTTLIDSLEEINFVQRLPDSNDRRKVWISLTKEGMEYLALKREKHQTYFKQMFGALSEEELTEFIMCLKKINHLMNKL